MKRSTDCAADVLLVGTSTPQPSTEPVSMTLANRTPLTVGLREPGRPCLTASAPANSLR
jgi:hypothetical protein